MTAWLLAMLLAGLDLQTATGHRSPFELPADLAGKTILFIGAHPDDEWGLAPILAEACLDRGARCRFLVVSEARSYGCLPTIRLRDPIACALMRRGEMRRSAALFGGEVEFLGQEDLFYAFNEQGVRRTLEEWARSSGGRRALVRRLEGVIRRHAPKLVFTLDPRHGSSCHAGHRAAARLVAEALLRIPARQRPEAWAEQTLDFPERSPSDAATIEAGGYVAWPETAAQTRWFDANRTLRDGQPAYEVALQVRRTHASQYPDEASRRRTFTPPAATRHVPLARLVLEDQSDFCSALRLDRPTLDVPGNRARFGIPEREQ